MINTLDADIIIKLLEPLPRVVITIHRGPDGDAIGSGLGWKHILTNAGISATVIAPDAYPEFLKWLPGNDELIIYESQKEAAQNAIDAADLIFCLDFNSPQRMGELAEPITKANKPIVVIDHHQEPAHFAQGYYTDDTASSTAEMVFRLSEVLGWENHINHDAALCLYTGIVTDTGSFRFSSVSPLLLRIAANLIEKGIDHTRIYREVYDSNTLGRLKLRGFALSEKLQVIPDAATAYISLTEKELKQFNFQKGDTEGLVNDALSIKNVGLAAFFSEKDGMIKISFRSKGSYDVNKLARKHFEGGGHVNAAGGRKIDTMKNTITLFEEIIATEADKIKQSI